MSEKGDVEEETSQGSLSDSSDWEDGLFLPDNSEHTAAKPSKGCENFAEIYSQTLDQVESTSIPMDTPSRRVVEQDTSSDDIISSINKTTEEIKSEQIRPEEDKMSRKNKGRSRKTTLGVITRPTKKPGTTSSEPVVSDLGKCNGEFSKNVLENYACCGNLVKQSEEKITSNPKVELKSTSNLNSTSKCHGYEGAGNHVREEASVGVVTNLQQERDDNKSTSKANQTFSDALGTVFESLGRSGPVEETSQSTSTHRSDMSGSNATDDDISESLIFQEIKPHVSCLKSEPSVPQRGSAVSFSDQAHVRFFKPHIKRADKPRVSEEKETQPSGNPYHQREYAFSDVRNSLVSKSCGSVGQGQCDQSTLHVSDQCCHESSGHGDDYVPLPSGGRDSEKTAAKQQLHEGVQILPKETENISTTAAADSKQSGGFSDEVGANVYSDITAELIPGSPGGIPCGSREDMSIGVPSTSPFPGITIAVQVSSQHTLKIGLSLTNTLPASQPAQHSQNLTRESKGQSEKVEACVESSSDVKRTRIIDISQNGQGQRQPLCSKAETNLMKQSVYDPCSAACVCNKNPLQTIRPDIKIAGLEANKQKIPNKMPDESLENCVAGQQVSSSFQKERPVTNKLCPTENISLYNKKLMTGSYGSSKFCKGMFLANVSESKTPVMYGNSHDPARPSGSNLDRLTGLSDRCRSPEHDHTNGTVNIPMLCKRGYESYPLARSFSPALWDLPDNTGTDEDPVLIKQRDAIPKRNQHSPVSRNRSRSDQPMRLQHTFSPFTKQVGDDKKSKTDHRGGPRGRSRQTGLPVGTQYMESKLTETRVRRRQTCSARNRHVRSGDVKYRARKTTKNRSPHDSTSTEDHWRNARRYLIGQLGLLDKSQKDTSNWMRRQCNRLRNFLSSLKSCVR